MAKSEEDRLNDYLARFRQQRGAPIAPVVVRALDDVRT